MKRVPKSVRTIVLRGGAGTVTVLLYVDLLNLSKRDSDLLNAIKAHIDQYEPGAPSGDGKGRP